MTPFEIGQLAVEVLVLLLLLYIAFLKSYFQEKGKNLATKEDVQEITELVESVKSQLEYSLQAKLSLRNLEREALVDYFSKYYVWQAAILNFGSVCIGEEEIRELEEARNQLNLLKTDFDLATGKMELFVENADISSQYSRLLLETAELSRHAVEVSYEIQQKYLENEYIKSETPPSEQIEVHRASLDERAELYRTYSEKKHERYSKLYPLILTHRSTIAKHLREMTLE